MQPAAVGQHRTAVPASQGFLTAACCQSRAACYFFGGSTCPPNCFRIADNSFSANVCS
jgi:hypothetical protein